MPTSPATYVQCNHGAGGDMSYEIQVDTRTQHAALYDYNNGSGDPEPAPMPPASVQMHNNSTFDVTLTVKCEEKYLYTGRIIVTAVVNGKRQQLSIGTPENPYKWINLPDSILNGMTADSIWDWGHFNTQLGAPIVVPAVAVGLLRIDDDLNYTVPRFAFAIPPEPGNEPI